MSGLTLGDTISMPGFEGRVVALFAGRSVIDGRLHGEIPAHAAEADELAVVLSGEVTIALDGQERICRPGDYLVIPQGVAHRVHAERECRLLLIG